MAALGGHFSGFLDNVICIFEKYIALASRFGPISVNFFAQNSFLCMINQ